MSKSKKNTVDPEVMIKKYGADAVRWFTSDSPQRKISNGQMQVLAHRTSFFKSYGTYALV